MRASRSERRDRVTAGPISRRLEAFLEMLAAERGAARLTLAAYRNDLVDLTGFLAARGTALEDAQSVSQPLHGGSSNEDRSLQGIGRPSLDAIADGGQQAVS